MTVRVYRWDDAGSPPVLTGQLGSLIALLDAVLVGTAGIAYGSKASSGWTKEFSGTNKAVYKNGAGSTGCYLRVDHSSVANYARVRGYRTCADIDAATSTVPTPTDAQVSGGLYLYSSDTTDATARPWVIVADSKRFYIWVGYNVTTATGLGTTAAMHMAFFGDLLPAKGDDNCHFALVASHTAAATNYFGAINTNLGGSTISGHYVLGTYAQVDGSLQFGVVGDSAVYGSNTSMGSGTGLPTYPDPVSGSMLLSEIRTHDSATIIRGKLPGLWMPLHKLPGSPGDTFTGKGPLNGKSFLLLDAAYSAARCRVVIETSDTWG